jgi:hypothetical protein
MRINNTDAVAAMTRQNVHNISAVPFVPPSLAIKEKKAEKQRIGGLEDPKAIAKRSRISVDEFQLR